MLRSRLFLAALAFAALSSVAAAATGPTVVTPATATWQPVPGFKGMQMATIVGNPDKAGYFAYYLKASAGAKAPPHFHKTTENVVVISGTMLFGTGDAMNVATMHAFGPGTAVSIPAGLHHYAMAKTAALIVINGTGPEDTTLLHK